MRKTILMGLGLALSFAGTAVAQQGGHEGHRRQNADGERGMRGPGGRGGPDGLLLKDITLTEGQRAQIAQLRKADRDKMGDKREQGRKQFEEARAARERGDTAAARAIMQRNRQAREAEHTQHLASIRAILTAEQRVQFDKNVAELKDRDAQRAERGTRGGKRGPGFGR